MADSVFSVTVPAGLAEGQTFAVQTPDGRMLNVTVPAGLSAGDLVLPVGGLTLLLTGVVAGILGYTTIGDGPANPKNRG